MKSWQLQVTEAFDEARSLGPTSLVKKPEVRVAPKRKTPADYTEMDGNRFTETAKVCIAAALVLPEITQHAMAHRHRQRDRVYIGDLNQVRESAEELYQQFERKHGEKKK